MREIFPPELLSMYRQTRPGVKVITIHGVENPLIKKGIHLAFHFDSSRAEEVGKNRMKLIN